MYHLYWMSEDGQGAIPMGEYPTEDEATDAIDDARAELLAQCGEDADREKITAGSWKVVRDN